MSKVKSQFGKGVEICVSWVDRTGSDLPAHAVDAGDSCFVIRAKHNGEYLPGKYVASHDDAYVCYGGHEGLEWKSANGSSLPNGAIVAGTDNGDPLYIARSDINSEVVVGKYLPGHECAYVPYDGKEIRKEQFEVLCCAVKFL